MGASEHPLQFSEKRHNEFWGLRDHRVLTVWVTGGRGGASQSPQNRGSLIQKYQEIVPPLEHHGRPILVARGHFGVKDEAS